MLVHTTMETSVYIHTHLLKKFVYLGLLELQFCHSESLVVSHYIHKAYKGPVRCQHQGFLGKSFKTFLNILRFHVLLHWLFIFFIRDLKFIGFEMKLYFLHAKYSMSCLCDMFCIMSWVFCLWLVSILVSWFSFFVFSLVRALLSSVLMFNLYQTFVRRSR